MGINGFESVKNTKEFSSLYNRAKKWHTKGAIIFYYEDSNSKKVGFTASKKIGNAVKRNFSKRRLRAVFIELQKRLKNGKYIFVAKRDILTIDYKKLKSETLFALKRLDAINR